MAELYVGHCDDGIHLCCLAAARREGYTRAVAVLLDDDRYRSWWSSLPEDDPAYGYWKLKARRHLADYLETVQDQP